MFKKPLIYLILSLFFLPLCGPQRSHSTFRILRLIDILKKENIEISPLSQLPQVDFSSDRIFPSKSIPLSDRGTGENPFFLKRKVKIFRESLNTLFAPPRSGYNFDLNVEEDTQLEFGIGLILDENTKVPDDSSEDQHVRFVIIVTSSNRQEVLFEEELKFPSIQDKQVYYHKSMDLSLFKGKCQISFQTSGKEGSLSFWVNPVLFPRKKSRRQIILISIDTLRADHLGVYGYNRDTSPNIDSLASKSVLFRNVYAPSPWTLSSHVSLLTALNTIHHQVYREDERMDPDLNTLAELLREQDFFCSALTGGGFVSSVFGFAQGFDTFYERTDEVLLDKAAELCYRDTAHWIDENADKDFFLFIHTYQPHDPYSCPAPFKTMFLSENSKWSHLNLTGYLGGKGAIFRDLSQEERQNIIDLYDAEIRYTDEKLIGPLIKKLKDLSLFDQAMIIFTSDHGEEFYEHKGWGHGHSLCDESLKVPLIIKFPESIYGGLDIETVVSLVDVMPTILDTMGIDNDLILDWDGKSLIPVLKGKERKDRAFFADVGENILNLHLPQKMTTNEGTLKLILNKGIPQKNLAFFLYPAPSVKAVELYDLRLDPFETTNIVDEKPTIASRILAKIDSTYNQAKNRQPGKVVLDEELLRQLRALG